MDFFFFKKKYRTVLVVQFKSLYYSLTLCSCTMLYLVWLHCCALGLLSWFHWAVRPGCCWWWRWSDLVLLGSSPQHCCPPSGPGSWYRVQLWNPWRWGRKKWWRPGSTWRQRCRWRPRWQSGSPPESADWLPPKTRFWSDLRVTAARMYVPNNKVILDFHVHQSSAYLWLFCSYVTYEKKLSAS